MSAKDLAIASLLVLGFASLVTIHVWITAKLVQKKPRYRGLLAFFVPPLAPIWGFGQGERTLATLWLVALGTYFVARLAALL